MRSRYVFLAVMAASLLLSSDCGVLAQGPFPAPPALTPYPFVSPLFVDDMVLQCDKADTMEKASYERFFNDLEDPCEFIALQLQCSSPLSL